MSHKNKGLDKYFKMLSYKRPAGSRSEKQFIKRFIDSVKGMKKDNYGNRYIVIGDSVPTTMFSSHTDTVHSSPGRQKLLIDETFNAVFSDGENCLGADDCSGVYIMLHLISNKTEGLYVFHRAEEIGGIGSDYFREHEIENWPTLKRCIAFDRKDTASVITAQMDDCCSHSFAYALAEQLHTKGNKWFLDDGGIFTDSANYVDVIAECTNLSVGYYNEHTSQEYQDYEFLQVFISKLLKVDWDGLPTIRIPEPAIPWWNNYGDEYDSHGNYKNDNFGDYGDSSRTTLVGDIEDYQTSQMTYQDIEDLCVYRPEAAILLLCDYYGIQKPEKKHA